MEHLIDKSSLVAEINRVLNSYDPNEITSGRYALVSLHNFLDTLEVKEVDIDKLCEFRKNIGFAYPEGASEYQKQLACYRQGVKDAIKAQKGE